MLKESQFLKEKDLLGKVVVMMKDGQDLYRGKIVMAEYDISNSRRFPNFKLEIVRENDGNSSWILSSQLFRAIEAGAVRWE